MFMRLYFDTNALFGAWPSPGAPLRVLFHLAERSGIQLGLPEVVEIELHHQMELKIDDAIQKLGESLQQFNDILARSDPERKQNIEHYIEPELDHESAMAAYDAACEGAKSKWKIRSIPLPSCAIKRFIEDAIHRVPPFAELKKDKGVIGFQDAVILESILEDVTQHPETLCALVTNDKYFGEAATRVGLTVYDHVEAAIQAIKEASPQYYAEFEHEEKIARVALERSQSEAEQYVMKHIKPNDFAWLVGDDEEIQTLNEFEMHRPESVIAVPGDATGTLSVSYILSGELQYNYSYLWGRFRRAATNFVWIELDGQVDYRDEHAPEIKFLSARASPIHREIEGVHGAPDTK